MYFDLTNVTYTRSIHPCMDCGVDGLGIARGRESEWHAGCGTLALTFDELRLLGLCSLHSPFMKARQGGFGSSPFIRVTSEPSQFSGHYTEPSAFIRMPTIGPVTFSGPIGFGTMRCVLCRPLAMDAARGRPPRRSDNVGQGLGLHTGLAVCPGTFTRRPLMT